MTEGSKKRRCFGCQRTFYYAANGAVRKFCSRGCFQELLRRKEAMQRIDKYIKEPHLLILGLALMTMFLVGTYLPQQSNFIIFLLTYATGYTVYYATLPLVWVIILSYVLYRNLKR